MKAYEQTLNYLNTLKLKGIAGSLDEMINDAERGKESYITFLNNLFTTEISYRVKRRKERNMKGAHFPVIKK
jgi:DNA replication protein DnaC